MLNQVLVHEIFCPTPLFSVFLSFLLESTKTWIVLGLLSVLAPRPCLLVNGLDNQAPTHWQTGLE